MDRVRRRIYVFDTAFPRRRVSYVAQALLATLTLGLVLALEDALANVAVVTAIASTAFLVFVNPRTVMAQPRRVIGGHLVACAVAFLFSYALYDSFAASTLDTSLARDIAAALAVGCTILAMAVTNTEHAPAAGTVLGLVLVPFEWDTALLVVVAATILSAVKFVLGPRLVDLV